MENRRIKIQLQSLCIPSNRNHVLLAPLNGRHDAKYTPFAISSRVHNPNQILALGNDSASIRAYLATCPCIVYSGCKSPRILLWSNPEVNCSWLSYHKCDVKSRYIGEACIWGDF